MEPEKFAARVRAVPEATAWLPEDHTSLGGVCFSERMAVSLVTRFSVLLTSTL